MKVSYEWLQSYFDEKLPEPEALAELLTFHAFEIESVERKGGDTIIDVDVLPNRSSDCLCHRGIARELATLLGFSLKDDPLVREPLSLSETSNFSVVIGDPELVKRFSAVYLAGVSVGETPAWMRRRLEAVGQRSINNIVDATNYVMLDIGQPLHAFDADKLTERDGARVIEVRVAKVGENITTLDGATHELDASNLLITDGVSGNALGVAGVKGGVVAEIDADTKNIILEAANFNFVSVRKTSQKLKIQTDASVRFQNQPSAGLTLHALRDVASLIGGVEKGGADHYPAPQKPESVSVSLASINGLLGTAITGDEVEDIFKRFSFAYVRDGETFSITPPFERTDLTIPEDVIEEVGRVYGYQHIEAEPLPPPSETPLVNKHIYYKERIRAALAGLGFSEVYTHALQAKGELELENALAADRPFLRSTLRDGLDAALTLNTHNADLLGLDEIKIFELGTVFSKEKESVKLGLAVRARGKSAEAKADAVVTYALEQLAEALGTDVAAKSLRGIAELDFDALISALSDPQELHTHSYETSHAMYRSFSVYPFALRDIALWAPEDTSSDDVYGVIRDAAGELLANGRQFDEYKKDGKVSYAFHLVFQSLHKTLSDDEINEVMRSIEGAVVAHRWEVR